MADLVQKRNKSIYDASVKMGYPAVKNDPFEKAMMYANMSPAERLGALAKERGLTGVPKGTTDASVYKGLSNGAVLGVGVSDPTIYQGIAGLDIGAAVGAAGGLTPTIQPSLSDGSPTGGSPSGGDGTVGSPSGGDGTGGSPSGGDGTVGSAEVKVDNPTGYEAYKGEQRYSKWYADELADAEAQRVADRELYQRLFELRIQQAKEQKAEALRYADILQERNTVNARTEGELTRAGYGRTAEQLASMGLTGSGYRDYLEGLSVMGERSGIQQATAERAKAEREASYAEILARYDAEAELLKGQHGADATARAANDANRSRYLDILAELEEKEAAKTETAGRSATDYKSALGMATEAKDVYDYVLSSGGSEEVARDVQASAHNAVGQDYLDMLKADRDGIDPEAIAEEYKAGNISEEWMKKLQKEYSKGGVDENTFKDGMSGKYFSAEEAKTLYEEAMQNLLYTDEVKEALKKEYERVYGEASSAKWIEGRVDIEHDPYVTFTVNGKEIEFSVKNVNGKDIKDRMSGYDPEKLVRIEGNYYFKVGKAILKAKIIGDKDGSLKKLVDGSFS